jgi:hypothetical protein
MSRTQPHPLSIILMASIAIGAIASAQSQQSSSSQSPVKVQPPTAAVSKASAAPPSTSKQQTPSIGKAVSARPADSPQDTDSFWVESIDIDGDGTPESADLLWDDEDKVLFLHDEGAFACQSGGQGNGEMLVAIYGDGNARQRPTGSGWYVVGLDAGECGVKAAGLFGCRFDAKGSATECGAAILKNDEVSIDPSK